MPFGASPVNSTARAVILAEKDALPLSEALAKFEVFDRLLVKEFGHPVPANSPYQACSPEHLGACGI
jgi:hypothetical protein